MSVLTDNLTLRGRTCVNIATNWSLAPWEWEWIADTFGWIRIDGNWNACELTEGVYTWTVLDARLAEAEQYGLGTLIILDYANTQVASYGFGTWNTGPATDAQVTAFTNWAVALAAHVDGKNVMLEVWNEPHNEGFWLPAPNAADYARLARATTAAIKAAYPDMPVIAGGGLAYADYETWTDQSPIVPSVRESVASDEDTGAWHLAFIKDIARRGGFAGADAVSFHPYQSEWPPEIIERQLGALKPYVPGDIVDTESGVANESIRIGKTGYYRPQDTNHNDTIGEDRAALYLVRKVLAQAAAGLKLTTIFAWRNIATDVYTESRPWPYKPQGGKDGAFNTYFGQALEGSYGLLEHDPEDAAQASTNYVSEYTDEYICDSIEVIDPGAGFCSPTVTALAGAPDGTGIIDVSLVDSGVIGTTRTGAGYGAVTRVGLAGDGTVGEINDVQVESAGAGYTYGFNLTVTDPDTAKATGTINHQAANAYTDDADGPILPASIVDAGEMTAAYLDFSGNLPYTTKATATLVSMNVGGFYYNPSTTTSTVDYTVSFNGSPCANGVKGYGYVGYLSNGYLDQYASTYGSIVLGVGRRYVVGDVLTHAHSLNGSGSGMILTVKALLHTSLGIIGSNSTYWTITDGGTGYQVGEVITFNRTGGAVIGTGVPETELPAAGKVDTATVDGADGAVITVTSIDEDTGEATGVYGLYGGTYDPDHLPTYCMVKNGWPTYLGDGYVSAANLRPFFTPNNIKPNAAGAGYAYPPAVKITVDPDDSGPGISGGNPGGARAQATLTTGTVTFINSNNGGGNNGLYYTLPPTIELVAGYESIFYRVRTFGGEVTDVFVDGPGVGLSPTQNIAATVKGGKWPCIVKFTAPSTWAIETGYEGQGYDDDYAEAYDLGTSIPTDANGFLDQDSVWDFDLNGDPAESFTIEYDEHGAVTTATPAAALRDFVAADGHYYVLAPCGHDALVGINLRPKPKPKQPTRKATALRDLMGWLGDYEYSENLSEDDKAYQLVFTKAGENDIHVLWRTTEEMPTGTLTVSEVSGKVLAVTIETPGVGLTSAPDIEFISATGSGAAGECLMFDGGLVSAVTITNGGSSYEPADTVRFTTSTPADVDTPSGAVRAWKWDGTPVTLGDSITLTDEPLFVEVEN